MAARPTTMDSRKFASPAVKALMSQRSAEFGGLLLGLLGLAILVALATYDPRDPSLNTATTPHVSNLAGPGGAGAGGPQRPRGSVVHPPPHPPCQQPGRAGRRDAGRHAAARVRHIRRPARH